MFGYFFVRWVSRCPCCNKWMSQKDTPITVRCPQCIYRKGIETLFRVIDGGNML